jgi:type IV pilus assembly protein PilE
MDLGRSRKHRRTAGFTLIELMIVVAIIAIIAAVAYPSFTDQVRKSRRAQAKADLLELAQLAERSRTVHNTYADFDLPFAQSPREGTARYQIQWAEDPDASTFELEAVPLDSQQRDPCGTLSVNQANQKTPAAADVTPSCW